MILSIVPMVSDPFVVWPSSWSPALRWKIKIGTKWKPGLDLELDPDLDWDLCGTKSMEAKNGVVRRIATIPYDT